MTFDQLGPYQIVRKLGRGGMGVVYEGVDVETGQHAAVKVLSAALSDEEDFRVRFEAEIETLRKLKHPNIVRLFGFGQLEGHLFYAMELVEGPSLETELRRGRRFDWRQSASIGVQVCRGLRHAHDRGVIHRDLKPGNLLLAADGTVKLSDFGIAQLFGRARLTSAGSILGTIEYMAPEQAEAGLVDRRADLYSLGGVLFALLTCRPPLRAKTIAEMIEKQRTAPPEPVGRYAADVPKPLEDIIAQLLDKEPERRIPNAAVAARRLEAVLDSASPEETAPDNGRDEPGFDLSTPAPADAPHAPGELPPTRAMDDGPASPLPALREAVAGEGPDPRRSPRPLAGEGPGVRDPLPETKDFTPPPAPLEGEPESPAHAAASALKTRVPEPPEPPAPPPAQFTPVGEEELDRGPEEDSRGALISVQTWILAFSLLSVGMAAWYFLQPPTADALYERIMDKTRDGSIESLRAAEPAVQDFLTRYSGDSRAEEVRDMEREIELDRMERRFELRASGRLSGGQPLSPCERAYLEAIHATRVEPERGIAKLEAILGLYDGRTDPSGPTGQCLELTRRRLERLRRELMERVPGQLAVIQDRLRRADELSNTDPEAARAMRKAVVELYSGKPWAAEAVARARESLARQASGPDAKDPEKNKSGNSIGPDEQ